MECSISTNGDFIRIVTMSDGGMSYAEPSAEPILLNPSASDEEIGAAVRLAASRSKTIPPKEFVKLFESRVIHQLGDERELALQKQFGYKSKRAMYKNFKHCSVQFEATEVKVEPSHQKALDGSYSGLHRSQTIVLPSTITNSELGAAVRDGFARCTSAFD
jgi:CDI immunity protein